MAKRSISASEIGSINIDKASHEKKPPCDVENENRTNLILHNPAGTVEFEAAERARAVETVRWLAPDDSDAMLDALGLLGAS